MTLRLEPANNLIFNGPFTATSTAVLTLINDGNKRLAFCMQTTAPRDYTTQPSKGLIEPHSRMDVHTKVAARPAASSSSFVDTSKHKFMVQWTAVPDSYEDNAENFWKQDRLNPQNKESLKLSCIFVDRPSATISDSASRRPPLKFTAELDSLDPTRVVGQEPGSELLCSICYNVLWNPVACVACQNAFCTQCIQRWTERLAPNRQDTCPFRCTFQEKRAPPVLNSLLSKLMIRCVYHDNGCPQILNYDAVDAHQRSCTYQRLSCSVCGLSMGDDNSSESTHGVRQCFEHSKRTRGDTRVQTQMLMLLDIIEKQDKRIKSLEDRLNNMST